MTPDIRLNYSIETWSFEGHGNILKFAWTPLQREANEIRPFFLFSLKPLDFLFSFDSRKSYGDEKLFLFFFFLLPRIISTMGMGFIYPPFEKLKVYDTIFSPSVFFFFSIPLLSWIEIARNLDIANIIGSVARFTIVLKYLSVKYLKRAVFVLKWNRQPINAFENGVKIYAVQRYFDLAFFWKNFLWDTRAK